MECLREKYIKIHIVYENTYLIIFVMISFVADAYDSRTSRICVVFLWIIIRQTCLLRYIISIFIYNRLTWIKAVIVEQVFLKKNLNVDMWGETSISILPHKTSFWYFCQSGTLPGSVNMEAFPNIWNRNTFGTTSLYALRVHRQFQRRKLHKWINFTVKLKLNSS